VRKLGASSHPGEQAQALLEIAKACSDDPDLHIRAAIVAVGAIPLLVPLLGPGSPSEVQQDAAFVLGRLSEISENVVTLASAGAIPLLVQLLMPGSTADVQEIAARTLANIACDDYVVTIASAGAIPLMIQLMTPSSPVMVQVSTVFALSALARHAGNAASIAAAGAIPLLVQFLDPGDGPPAAMQGVAAGTLHLLAVNAEDAATIAASVGAIPLLVQLLKPGPGADVREAAAHVLGSLAANAETAVLISASGAIPLLAQLLKPGSDDVTKAAATLALEALKKGVAANRAAVAAAKAASADMVQAIEGLGVGSSSDVQT
jgi:hypothetical protein